MVTMFNRREVFCTFSIEAQADARKRLADNNIDYDLKVVDRSFHGVQPSVRAGLGRFGEDQGCSKEYVFFVKKNDYDMAKSALGM